MGVGGYGGFVGVDGVASWGLGGGDALTGWGTRGYDCQRLGGDGGFGCRLECLFGEMRWYRCEVGSSGWVW